MTKNDSYIQFLLPEELKGDFYKFCKKNATNPSEWLRQRVTEFVVDAKKKHEKNVDNDS